MLLVAPPAVIGEWLHLTPHTSAALSQLFLRLLFRAALFGEPVVFLNELFARPLPLLPHTMRTAAA